jgi:hypothetical protein
MMAMQPDCITAGPMSDRCIKIDQESGLVLLANDLSLNMLRCNAMPTIVLAGGHRGEFHNEIP